jgi:hypothetical protein
MKSMDAMISKGRFNTGQGLLAIFLSAVLLLVSMYLFQNAFSFKYLQIDRLIIAIIFSLLFLYFLFKGFLQFKAVNVHEDHLMVRWFFGIIRLRFYKNDIELYGLTSMKDTRYTYIRKGRFYILFNETLTENNAALTEQLRNWAITRRDNISTGKVSKFEEKIGDLGMIIISILLCAGLIYTYYHPVPSVDARNLTIASGHLSRPPSVKKPGLRSSTKHVVFNLKEYPSLNFEVNSLGFKAVNTDLLNACKEGDNVTLLITNTDYTQKLVQTAAPAFSEKHFNWPSVNTYAVGINNKNILRFDDFNAEVLHLQQSNRRWGWVLIGLSVIILFLGMRSYVLLNVKSRV